jgi:hypothetical protein
MTFFYGNDEVTDPLYSKIRNPRNELDCKARLFTEQMWASCCLFIDENAIERARKDDFYAVWWELYAAYALSRAGIALVPTKDRVPSGRGHPDLVTADPPVWVEAIMPQPGIGPDAIAEPVDKSIVFWVPRQEFVLRLRAAVQEKSTKLLQYLRDKTIPSGEATIIAVSGGRLPFRFQDYPVPNIVQAVYGVGNLQVHIAVESNTVLGTSIEYRDHVVKKSKARVPTDFFLQPESAHVSAVLYSASDCVNYPEEPGTEFILVHNPKASVPLPHHWLPVGTQYWMDGKELRREAAS